MIEYNKKARIKLKRGVDALANAVKVTLGPKGRNVILSNINQSIITKDGVSVAREVLDLEDSIEQIGANMIKEVSLNTNNEVGDGTTTATVIAQTLLEYGFKLIDSGVHPLELKNKLDAELDIIIDKLNLLSTPIESEEQIYSVANISTNGDSELAEIIFNLYKEVGDNILFEESKTDNTYYETTKGMQFNSSYLSYHFINDSNNRRINYEDSLIFIYNDKIENIKQILPVLEYSSNSKKPVTIIAEEIDDNTIINIVTNVKKGNLQASVIKSPGFGFGRTETLKDISVYTGAKIYSKNDSLEKIIFGKCDNIIVDELKTIITGSYGNKDEIASRIKELETLYNKKDNIFQRNKIKERISKFKNGIGVIYIGATSEVEMKERKDRLEDAINAVKASEEGIVPGGGYILKYIAEELYSKYPFYKNSIKKTIYKTLTSPYNQIDLNSGEKRKFKKDIFYKYLDNGIIDPVKVTKTALKNAFSVVGTILTTETIIVHE